MLKYFFQIATTLLALMLVLTSTVSSFAAQEAPQTFTYQGRLLNAAGTAPLSGSVDIKFGIYDSSGNCLLYEEQQNINISSTGIFALQLGSIQGHAKRLITGRDPNLTMSQVFSTRVGQVLRPAASSDCAGGYTI